MEVSTFLPGFALLATAFVLFFGVLAAEGALAKEKQLAALSRVGSGASGSGRRAALLAAVILGVVGECLCFGAVARSDQQRARRCSDACRQRGYPLGRIRAPAQPVRPPRPVCACEGRGEPVELPADAP